MRVLLVINVQPEAALPGRIVVGRSPRKDYLELQHALNADIVDLGTLDGHSHTRLLRRLVGPAFAQAFLAWLSAPHYDVVFADQETTGFILAALFKLKRQRPRLTMIGHLLSPPGKQILFRALRAQETVDCLIVHSSLQHRVAERSLGLRPDQVALVPYQTDERFWTPQAHPLKNQICSAGLEYRDYDTLIQAVRGLDVGVVIAAASHWSKHAGLGARDLPPNVRAASYDYAGLRQLYAESRFVVVPLRDVDNQAGITTILEAMSMGKAVIVSLTRGQFDVVRDRRRVSRADARRTMQPDWAERLGATGSTAQSHTGIYVTPGDADELRRAIVYLLEHPEAAQAMGANGRRLVEEAMSLNLFTERLSRIIRGDTSRRADGASAAASRASGDA